MGRRALGPEKKRGATERMTSVTNRGWTSENSGAVNLTREADRLVSSRDERIDWQKKNKTRQHREPTVFSERHCGERLFLEAADEAAAVATCSKLESHPVQPLLEMVFLTFSEVN